MTDTTEIVWARPASETLRQLLDYIREHYPEQEDDVRALLDDTPPDAMVAYSVDHGGRDPVIRVAVHAPAVTRREADTEADE